HPLQWVTPVSRETPSRSHLRFPETGHGPPGWASISALIGPRGRKSSSRRSSKDRKCGTARLPTSSLFALSSVPLLRGKTRRTTRRSLRASSGSPSFYHSFSPSILVERNSPPLPSGKCCAAGLLVHRQVTASPGGGGGAGCYTSGMARVVLAMSGG